jgi:hypothetical protein
MRTFLKRVIFVGVAGGAMLAVSLAVRSRSADNGFARPVGVAREVEAAAQKPRREYPAFVGNIEHVLSRLGSLLVADELKLTAEQLAALRAAGHSYWLLNSRLPKLMERAGEKGNALDRYRVGIAHEKEVAELLVKTLQILQPDQKKRLHEIMCQTYGLQIFDNDEIADSLRLSKEQYAFIAQITTHTAFEQWQLIKAAGMDAPQVVTPERERIERECDIQQQRLEDQAIKTIVAEFNDDQKAAYARLVGAPIDVAAVVKPWLTQSYNYSDNGAGSLGKRALDGPASATVVPATTTR